MLNTKKLQKAIINVEKEWLKNQENSKTLFTDNKEANTFLLNNPLAFILAVIYDQGIKAERAWELPYILKNRLGHLNVKKIAKMDKILLIKIFQQKPKLHRFPTTMAERTIQACQLLLRKYDGKAENIWNDNPKASDVQFRFQEFEGIGQKKASMATNTLVRDLDVQMRDKSGIDISYDIHIRRIFLRTGLIKKDDMKFIVNKARELNPDYPGVLDLGCWITGRSYCFPKNPDCKHCPLNKYCAKLTKKGSNIKA